jgi:pyruvate/2-oxoglutarate dehydrogenase complex dihydrolipoamide acyltransferase (E2) component
VKADDVVAMIETDKVTVEIKAEVDGVVTKHFGTL